MSHIASAANEGILSYGISTNPDPIQASPASGNPSLTSLVVTVSNNTQELIYCNKLTFSFPIGDLAQDLGSTGDGILVASNPSDKWDISVTSSGVFTATPKSPDNNAISTDGLSFQIYNIQTNRQVGTFTLSVTESSSKDNSTFSDKKNIFHLAKFPYGFYVKDFSASAPLVDDGQPVTLTWSGSDLATYTILYEKQSVDVTNVRTWTSPSLTATTTFALKASLQKQGETVEVYLYVTVIVSNPEVYATSLHVKNNASIGGTLSVTQTITGVGMSPPGSILMYYGPVDSVFDSSGAGIAKTPYEGWQLCNGKNGAPDLQDRFIVGAGHNYQVGNTGGSDTRTLTLHNMPAHNHMGGTGGSAPYLNYPGVVYCSKGVTSGIMVNIQTEDKCSGNRPNLLTTRGHSEIQVNSHNHSIPSQGNGEPFDARPQYYALAYIYRIG